MSRPNPINMLKSKRYGRKRGNKLTVGEESNAWKDWLPAKVIDLSSDRPWKNCELLYWIPVIRKDKIQVKSKSDRFLFLFYNSEQSDGFLINVSSREGDVDFKKSWHLSDIKAIEFQENSVVFKLFLEHEYSWSAISNIDRNEAVWIIIHVCKHLCNNDIKVESSMRLKMLGLALTTNNTLSTFHLLRKYLDENMDTENRDILGNDLLTFTPEETDAEKLFDELHWGLSESEGGSGDPAMLQNSLRHETESLFVEICDFLLQWEEDEDKETIIKGMTGRSTGSSGTGAKVRETFELLASLDDVDASLESVDSWLSEQVTYLSDVQSQLFQIESENSGLETSWHNLTAVKSMITNLLNGPLSLDDKAEELLRHPQKVVREALEEKSLVNTSLIVAPLVDAICSLRRGLEEIDGKSEKFTPMQWRHIQAMTVISEHGQKLRQLSSDVCNGLEDVSHSLFKSLAQHKCLHDEKYGGKPIRRFSFSTVVNSVKEAQGAFKLLENDDESDNQEDKFGSAVEHPPDGTSTLEAVSEVSFHSAPQSDHDVVNQIAMMQRDYHSMIYPFFSLIKNMSELDSSLQKNLCESYVNYTEKYLYSSLFKELFRELFDLHPPRHSKDLMLSSMPKCQAGKITSPPLLFQHPSICRSGSPLSLSMWTIFSCVVRLSDEVIRKEHIFLCRIILNLGRIPSEPDKRMDEKIGESALSRLFATYKDKLLKLASSPEYADGVELFGMLVTVQMLLNQRLLPQSYPETENLSIWNISMEEVNLQWDFVEESLLECKKLLSSRLDNFVQSQIAWFQEKKVDHKKTGVLSPFARFPAFIDQVMVFAGKKSFDFVDMALEDIASELMIWIHGMASKNEKYHDVILIHNLAFLVQSLQARREVTALSQVLLQAQQEKESAEKRYIKWMISYEFPKYAGLAERISDLGGRATSDQLGLYIRREDVSKAVSKMDKKTIEHGITAVRKRLEKHFSTSTEVAGLNDLMPTLWQLLCDEVSSVFSVVERVARDCYQINVVVDEEYVSKYAKNLSS